MDNNKITLIQPAWLVTFAAIAIIVTSLFWLITISSVNPSGTPEKLLVEPEVSRFPFLQAINTAKESIDIAGGQLSDPQILQALKAAAARGIAVRAFVDHNPAGVILLTDKAAKQIQWEVNRGSLLPHPSKKILLIDNQYAFVLTFDFVPESFAPSGSVQRNFGIMFSSREQIAELKQIFADDWKTEDASDIDDPQLIWTPVNASSIPSNFIDHATAQLDLYAYRVTDPLFVTYLLNALKRKIQLRLLISNEAAQKDIISLNQLSQAGAQIRRLPILLNDFTVMVSDRLTSESKAYLGAAHLEVKATDKDATFNWVSTYQETTKALIHIYANDWKMAVSWKN